MGYGGWELYFDPEFIQAVIDFAAQRPNDANLWEGYEAVCNMVVDRIIRRGPQSPQLPNATS
jgi:hypothetical protein